MRTWACLSALVILVGAADASAARKKSNKVVTGVVNLNQATAQQLDLLPGVGQKAAQRIIEHRQKTPFTRVEELVKVKGFGKKKFEKLKPHLALTGPSTLRVAATPDDGPARALGRTAPGR